MLVVGLFILTFLAQNFVIPSGSMEQTLLVGDHLVVDRITLAPPTKWMPLVHYREPKRGDIVVFIKPGELDADGKPTILFLVKRLIGIPGDHIHLAQWHLYRERSCAEPSRTPCPLRPRTIATYLDDFPAVPMSVRSRRNGALGRGDAEPRGGWRPCSAAGKVLHDGRQSPRQSRLALLGICSAREHCGPAAVQLLVVQNPRTSVR